MSIFSAPSFYGQEDQDIYNQGFSFIPQLAYRGGFNPNQSPSLTPAPPATGITTLPVLPIQPQGRDDDFRGGGLFGNLDLSKSKEFVRDVFSRDLVSGPMEAVATGQTMPTGSFKPEVVTGFYNPKLGTYQTFAGKNITHGGINIKPAFAGILEGLGFGGEDEIEDEFGNKYKLGSIRGTFTGFRPGKFRDIPAALFDAAKSNRERKKFLDQINKTRQAQNISLKEALAQAAAIERERGTGDSAPGGERGDYGNPGGSSGEMTDDNVGTYCFDPNTLVQMADGSEKKIKEIQLGDQTKGGEVTGVFQFKASDEIHDYKGVTVAGSHYVKENGRFIMVQDSPISVKIDKIPVVYSLDTTGRRIFIKDIEFADYNGDGIAKGFLANAGVNLTGFDKEVLRQVENRLI